METAPPKTTRPTAMAISNSIKLKPEEDCLLVRRIIPRLSVLRNISRKHILLGQLKLGSRVLHRYGVSPQIARQRCSCKRVDIADDNLPLKIRKSNRRCCVVRIAESSIGPRRRKRLWSSRGIIRRAKDSVRTRVIDRLQSRQKNAGCPVRIHDRDILNPFPLDVGGVTSAVNAFHGLGRDLFGEKIELRSLCRRHRDAKHTEQGNEPDRKYAD